MRRCLADLAPLLLLAGCAFDDGEPWGRAQVTLQAAFDPAGRLAEGRLKTSNDYRIELTALRLRLDAVTLRMAGAGALSFDPASPPPGYSLCHGGHCHADDGRLVAYEDIEAELAGGSAGFTLTQPTAAADVAVDPAGDAAAVPLAECPDACRLERGRLAALEVAVPAVELTGTVHDPLGRLAGPLPFTGTVELDRALAASLDVAVDRDGPVDVRLAVRVAVSARAFDGIDWAAHAADETLNLGELEGFAHNLEAASTVTVEVRRD